MFHSASEHPSIPTPLNPINCSLEGGALCFPTIYADVRNCMGGGWTRSEDTKALQRLKRFWQAAAPPPLSADAAAMIHMQMLRLRRR